MVTKKKSELKSEPPTHEQDPILKCGDVARQLGVHRTTIWRWAQTGLLESIRMPGNHVGVRKSQVNEILRASAFFKNKRVE